MMEASIALSDFAFAGKASAVRAMFAVISSKRPMALEHALGVIDIIDQASNHPCLSLDRKARSKGDVIFTLSPEVTRACATHRVLE